MHRAVPAATRPTDMSVAVIADAHLGGPGGESGPLLRQLERLPDEGCRQLVLLGDLFHVWVAHPRYETPEVRAVTGALKALKAAGVRLDYVEGNRDFFVQGSVYAALFDQVAREIAFEAGGKRYLAVHGDGLDDRDRKYRFWRWLSKSAASRYFMLHLPGWLARSLVHRTEQQLAKTNFKHKSSIPREVILRYAARRLGSAHDALLLGHFHEERRWDTGRGEVVLLDAWFRSRRVEWFGGGDAGSRESLAK